MVGTSDLPVPVACILSRLDDWAHSCRPEGSHVSTSIGMQQRRPQRLACDSPRLSCLAGHEGVCVCQGLSVSYSCAGSTVVDTIVLGAHSHALHEKKPFPSLRAQIDMYTAGNDWGRKLHSIPVFPALAMVVLLSGSKSLVSSLFAKNRTLSASSTIAPSTLPHTPSADQPARQTSL
ncbi:hypothetical protein IAQ61_007674 [Plenodomus lingam]|uniref:uncharacterized protein n=1 Tax=Leptosphaeria maculans TaxID=5022 RepID=UPI00331B4A7D|nr:hypothetical protein IAQ61_007674 [Plenodomus lingam]